MTMLEGETAVENVQEYVLPEKANSKKRALERDDEYDEEAEDRVVEFGEDGRSAPVRRGRKEGRRVSGVYREIKSLQSIGQNGPVMEHVFGRMTLKEVMQAASANSMWYIVACRLFRKRLGNASFLRLWASQKSPRYLWMKWELHFHEELLSGTDQDEPMEMEVKEKKLETVPEIQALFTIGSRSAFNQLTDEEAKLPYRQDHLYAICEEAVVTAPDFSFTETFRSRYEYTGTMAIQTLFIPKSDHFSVRGFGVEYTKESWTANEALGRVQLPQEDTPNQQLLAVMLLKYQETEGLLSFCEGIKSNGSITFLGGNPEEVGCNRAPVDDYHSPVAAGFSIYGGQGANVTLYCIDWLKENVETILAKMKAQAESSRHGFCFILYYDGRSKTSLESYTSVNSNLNSSMDWGDMSDRPEPMTDKVLQQLRTTIPKTPLVGIHSCLPVDIQGPGETSNVGQDHASSFTTSLLFVTYKD